jgi:uncharacterized protein (DUF58 family)
MFFGSSTKLKSVTASHCAALAAWKVLAVGDRVGGIVFNDTHFTEIKPRRDRKAVQSYLQMLVEKNNALSANSLKLNNPEMLNEVLRKTINLVNHDYLVLVISDFIDFDKQTMKSLIALSRHNDIILFLITDPMESELPEGDLILSDGELQIAAKTGDKNFRQNFGNDHLKKLDDIRNKTKGYGITLLELSTTEPVSNQIRTLLTQGRKIK